jgi:hypothetical protein
LPRRIIECSELHARDHGAEGRVEGLDIECAGHVSKLSEPSPNRQTSRDFEIPVGHLPV